MLLKFSYDILQSESHQVECPRFELRLLMMQVHTQNLLKANMSVFALWPVVFLERRICTIRMSYFSKTYINILENRILT